MPKLGLSWGAFGLLIVQVRLRPIWTVSKLGSFGVRLGFQMGNLDSVSLGPCISWGCPGELWTLLLKFEEREIDLGVDLGIPA